MCVWFPRLPLQRLRAERPGPEPKPEPEQAAAEPPFVIFAEGRRGFQVTVCSSEAELWGIHPGMPLGEVRSLLPVRSTAAQRSSHRNRQKNRVDKPLLRPVLKRADPVADRLRLQELAHWCHQYTPLAGLEEGATPESIWLDISGSESLFGGERGLAERLQLEFARQRIQIRVAIADSWGAAWGISHFGEAEIALVPAGQQAAWLGPLPVAALRISETVRESLQKLDVVTIAELQRLPRTSLPSRFGKELLSRLDQALGGAAELLQAERLVEPLLTEWPFEEPVTDRQTLDHVCEVLLERLLVILEERRVGLQELVCHWLGSTTEPTRLRLLQPTTQKRHLLELLRLQNERRLFHTGVHGVRMEAVEIGLPSIRQRTLFADEADDPQPQALAELVDRLSVRLSPQRVLRLQLTADPQPEFACQAVPWLAQQKPLELEGIPSLSRLRCRPSRLFSTPQPLVVQAFSRDGLPRQVNHSSVVRVGGPERIETGWWRGPDTKRDYYRLDLANGVSLWVFVDRDSRCWFLHGLFT